MQFNTIDSALARAREYALAMISDDRPLRETLTFLVKEGESVSGPHSVCSVLLLDQEGLLRNGASPNLPADYLDAIDRLRPDPEVGTCAAAAATGRVVITTDLRDDRRWRELKHLPLALGFLSAWSQPITAADGSVLGTFGTYFRDLREPRPDERGFIDHLARLAALAIQHSRRAAGAARRTASRPAAS